MAIKAGDQVTIVDLTDAYSVQMSMDAISVNASNSSTLGSDHAVTLYITTLRGSEKFQPTIGSISKNPNNSNLVVGTPSWDSTNFRYSVGITLKSALASDGYVDIPVTVDTDVTITKRFSFSIAFVGPKGDTGAAGDPAYTILLTNESHTFPAGQTYGVVGSSTECGIIALKGGTQIASSIGTITGVPTGMTTSITGNNSTSNKFSVAVSDNNMSTANGVLTIPITADGKSFNKSFSYSLALTGPTGATGPQGETGATGATGIDAITLDISTDNGIFFKNNTGQTTLTATVRKGGNVVTGSALSALGTIYWYKNGTKITGATGTTYVVGATGVTGQAVFEAKLES